MFIFSRKIHLQPLSLKSNMKYVNVITELSSLMILSVNHLLSKIKHACWYSKDSITISIINQITVIAPAFFIVIKSFLINKAKHLKLKCNKLARKKTLIYTCADLYSMQLNQTFLSVSKIHQEFLKHFQNSYFLKKKLSRIIFPRFSVHF